VGNGRRALAPHEQEFVKPLLAMLKDEKQRAEALALGIPYFWGKPPEVELTEEAADTNSTLAAVSQMSDEELVRGLTVVGSV
jgi:hypothetical protein